jgi:hypothetical protein
MQMEDYAQIYWLDPRNADSRDHRTQGGTSSGWRPSGPVVRSPGQPTSVIRYPAPAYPAPHYPAPAYPVYPAQSVAVMQPATYFGGFTVGQIIEVAAQALAALQPLPAAPVATSDVSTDVGNMILYQTAIAQHAKRDEQLRTLGSLISKLVK